MSEKSQLDLASSATKANPYPTFSFIRETEPVYLMGTRDGQNTWLITRYEDALAVLKDQRFIKNARRLLTPEEQQKAPDGAYSMLNAHMLSSDPPDHTRLRALVNISFTPRLVENLRPRIQAITDELIDEILQRKEPVIDLINTFAFPLPIIVITEMLGVPTEDREKFRAWSNALLDGAGDPTNIGKVRDQMMAFTMYLHNLIQIKREHPTEDLVGQLMQAESGGDKLDEREVISMIFLLLVAGHETTVNLIGNSVLALIQYPEQRQLLQENPSLIKAAIEEFLRFSSPVATSTNRWTGEDLEFGGKHLRKGDMVLVSLSASNLDPQEFPDAEKLDITRKENRHLAFGMGIHYCLGAPLARMEGQIAIQGLLKRLPQLQLAVNFEDLRWRPSVLISGVSELPVSFTPTP